MRRQANALVGFGIAVLAALLLISAVDRLRNEAALADCGNKIRQLALSFHNYESAYGRLPHATITRTGLPPDKRLSWLFEIDPYLESRMDPTWGRHRDEPWDSPGNQADAAKGIPLMLCCRNQHSEPFSKKNETSYVGVSGIGADAAMLETENPNAGALGHERDVRFADMKDGLSNTLCVIESSLESGHWMAGGFPTVRGYEERLTPWAGFHSRFVPAGCLDGSVRNIRIDVEPGVFKALFTIAGDEGESLPW